MAYIPKKHRLSDNININVADLDINDILLLEDGHCFRDGVLNLCSASRNNQDKKFQIESGSFETLIELANEGLGMTLLPYLHSKQLQNENMNNCKHFTDPKPAREVSLLYHKNELKIQITTVLKDTIDAIVRGAIAFHNVNIINPKRRQL